MADTPTTSGKYRKQGLGDRSAAWGLSSGLNGVFDSLDEAIHGVNVVSLATTNYTLTSTNYTSNESRQKFHRFTDGGIASQATINVPAVDNWWVISNGISAQSLLVSNGSNSVNVAAGQTAIVGNDGTNMYAFPFATSFISADPGANGVVVRTSEGVTTARTLTGTSGEITVTNGSGISGNPTLSIPTAFDLHDKTITRGSAVTVSAALASSTALNIGVPEANDATYLVATTATKNTAQNFDIIMASNADGDGNDLKAGIRLGTITSNDALGSDSYISMYTNNYGASRDVRLHIDKDGNIGVGTTAPLALLSVGAGSLSDSNFPMQLSSSGAGSVRGYMANKNGGYGVVFGYDEGSVVTGGFIRQITTDPLYLIVNNTTVAAAIDSSGNVGINELSPDYKLDVNGAIGFAPGSSVTPVDNGDVVIEATNNTTLTFKLKGSDGTVRSGTITLS